MPWGEIVKRKTLSKGRSGVSIEDEDGNPLTFSRGELVRTPREVFRVGVKRPEDEGYYTLIPVSGDGKSLNKYIEYRWYTT
jgi:hypothetical protein